MNRSPEPRHDAGPAPHAVVSPGAGRPAGTGSRPDPGGRRIRWCGDVGFLVECDSLAEVLALRTRIAAEPPAGLVDTVPAASTVALTFAHHGAALAGVRQVARLADLGPGDPSSGDRPAGEGRLVEIDVVYDGEDLTAVADRTGWSTEGLVRWHTETPWVGAFGGFAPGFTYAVPEMPGAALDVPRRDSPRTRVPAGSVALAGPYSAVYPLASPGGWQLIGRTDAPMWDEHRQTPALVAPGDRVHYRCVRELLTVRDGGAGRPAPDCPTGSSPPTTSSAPHPASGLRVQGTGLLSLLQDRGRAGQGGLGVPSSGAADADAARQANRLVGNGPDAAVIETLLGGLSLRARGHHVLALTGAEHGGSEGAEDGAAGSAAVWITAAPGGVPADRTVPARAPFALYDGEVLTLGEPTAGLRTYVAVRGGIDAPAVLGSRSTDLLSGLGPDPLSAGTELPVGARAGGAAVGPAEPLARPLPRAGQTTVVRVVPGPRDDWFGAPGLERLAGQEWRVGQQSNRIGVRLQAPEDGHPLERLREGELPSEGVATGSLQVPTSGLPVLFLADHPVTGGYPVIAVVVAEDLPLAAQLPPGARVRFELAGPDRTALATIAPETSPPRKDPAR